MIRLLLTKAGAVLASLVFLMVAASPSVAVEKLIFDRSQTLFDSDCTDTFSVPATTVNVNLTTTTNWDTFAEAVNPALNKDDAAQTSGSADGWCDATPWIMKGTFTIAADEELYIGPFGVPPTGFYLFWDFSSIGTTYSFDLGYKTPWAAVWDDFMLFADSTVTSPIFAYYGPTDNNLSVSVDPSFGPFPSGLDYYLFIDLNGVGTFTWDMTVQPSQPFFSRGR